MRTCVRGFASETGTRTHSPAGWPTAHGRKHRVRNDVPTSRSCGVPSRLGRGGNQALALQAMRRRGGHSPQAEDPPDPRRGGGRVLLTVWLRPVHLQLELSPHGPVDEDLPDELDHRSITCGVSRGGEEVRTALRAMPRRDRMGASDAGPHATSRGPHRDETNRAQALQRSWSHRARPLWRQAASVALQEVQCRRKPPQPSKSTGRADGPWRRSLCRMRLRRL